MDRSNKEDRLEQTMDRITKEVLHRFLYLKIYRKLIKKRGMMAVKIKLILIEMTFDVKKSNQNLTLSLHNLI